MKELKKFSKQYLKNKYGIKVKKFFEIFLYDAYLYISYFHLGSLHCEYIYKNEFQIYLRALKIKKLKKRKFNLWKLIMK